MIYRILHEISQRGKRIYIAFFLSEQSEFNVSVYSAIILTVIVIPVFIVIGIVVSREKGLLEKNDRFHYQNFFFHSFLGGRSRSLLRHQLQAALRKPQTYWIFALSLIVISASFAVAYNSMAGVTYNLQDVSRLTPQLINVYRFLSIIGLVLFVPVIGVSTIMQERDAGTLDLILTSATHPMDFILSKTSSAFILVLVILIGMAPVMSVTFCMGGVSPVDVFGVLAVQIFLTIIALAVSITLGSYFSRFAVALVASYGIVGFFSLIVYTSGQHGSSAENIILPLFLLVLGMACSLSFLAQTPRFLTRELNQIKPKWWRPISLKGFDAQLWTFLGARDYGDPINDHTNPIYVAERDRFFNAVVRRDWDAPSILFLSSVLLSITALFPQTMLCIEYVIILVFTPIVGASLFSSEHERANWENLRSTLLQTPSIFWGKMKLAVGHGLIHAYSFYVPPLLILGIIWFTSCLMYPNGVGYIKNDNLFRVWAGHALVFITLGFTVLFLSALSVMISTLHKRTLPALLQSYLLSALFLFAPWYFALLHPDPSVSLGGDAGMDGFALFLTVWNGPYVFNLWPSVSDRGTEGFDTITQFWSVFGAHIFLLILLTILCTMVGYKKIHRADD